MLRTSALATQRASNDLDGRNLLVYGENGAGKSSIFHGLFGFFSLKPIRELLADKNVFSGEPPTGCAVANDFNDNSPQVIWNVARHPVGPGAADTRVAEAALRKSCLDYRALLDTNYRHGNDPINLFGIAVHHLLADFQVPVAGGTTSTIGDLWHAVDQAKPFRHNKAAIDRVNLACVERISGLLSKLIDASVSIEPFVFNGITYNAAHFRRDRTIQGQTLELSVSFREQLLRAGRATQSRRAELAQQLAFGQSEGKNLR